MAERDDPMGKTKRPDPTPDLFALELGAEKKVVRRGMVLVALVVSVAVFILTAVLLYYISGGRW